MSNAESLSKSAETPRDGIPLCYLQLLLLPARAKGYDTDALLRHHGLLSALDSSPNQIVTMLQFARILRRLRRLLHDEMIAVTDRPVRPGTFLLVVRQMLQCTTLGEALRLGCSLYRLVIEDFSPRLRIYGDVARLEIVDASPPGTFRSIAHLMMLYGAIGLMSWMVQRPIAVHEVTLPASYPSLAPADALFQAPVRAASISGISFESSHLNERVVTDIGGLRTFLLHWPIRKMAPYSEKLPLAVQVRKRLIQRDIAHLPAQAELAATMGLTDKALRRRLFQEGQSYRAIVDALRRDAAIRLLEQSRLSVAEIGIRLGFSEPSAFHRAFRRATGLTPNQFRRQASVDPN
ncbi:helix-turn-helix domain-containing protein [Cupriavidus metallidurans]|uniref:Transcriptional regulator, AraC family n=1 Tax=Cupriavidus metallidurans (strain ATCC 43123 / DSM 2839 / NBRC 102507 / CH34) TaxID=266264 RepID=Q1LBV4_CUPMC|nr:AraC family transcriptional regulator [Cupriavidus metallidurans]ABF12372.1 putative transcriptional regulator, AraC family [Cupriavidus metallidurans CH34]QGS32398.1 helix-turn-helix domain-containing protein [Cupriavidus metallidurans]